MLRDASVAETDRLGRLCREIELRLAGAVSVRDFAIVTYHDSEEVDEDEVQIYLVGVGNQPVRKLEGLLADITTDRHVQFRVSVFIVSNIPLAMDGRVDVRALLRVPAIDGDTALTARAEFERLCPGASVTVEVTERESSTPWLHSMDLGLPRQRFVESMAPQPEEREPNPPIRGSAAGRRPLALVSREPLKIAPDAPGTLAQALIRAAREAGDRGVGYINEYGQWSFQTYRQLYDHARNVAAGLVQRGMGPGTQAILQLSENGDFVPTFWGCILAGVAPAPLAVPVSYHGDSSHEARVLLAACEFLDQPVIITTALNLNRLKKLIEDSELEHVDVLTREELHRVRDASVEAATSGDSGQPALFLFTSGSTGQPKCIAYSHRQLLANVAASAAHNRVTREDVSLNWLHLDHVGALVRCCIRDVYVGNTQIHVATQQFLHNPLRWFDWIEEHRVTLAWAPNFGLAMVNKSLQKETRLTKNLSSLRSILSVAEPIVPSVAREFVSNCRAFGLSERQLHSAWGMTETCAAVVFSHDFLARPDPDDSPFVEAGCPVPGLSIRVVDRAGETVEEGTSGNVQLCGEMIASEYYGNPRATEESFTDDGWLDTGDVGFIRDGRLTITGRSKDVIIINGRNIASREVESLVDALDGVRVACTAAFAIREADSDTDQLVVVFSPVVDDQEGNRQQVEAILHCVALKSGVRPSYILPLAASDIPRSSSGKILRAQLRERFLAGQFDEEMKLSDTVLESARAIPSWFTRRKWVESRQRHGARSTAQSGTALIIKDSYGLGESLKHSLEAQGVNCISVAAGPCFRACGPGEFEINLSDEADYDELVACLDARHPPVDAVFHLAAYGPPCEDDVARLPDAGIEDSFLSLVYLARAVTRDRDDTVVVQVCASHSQLVLESDNLVHERALAFGVVNSLPQEQPLIALYHCDLEGEDPRSDAAVLLEEYCSRRVDREVAYRQGRRFAPTLVEVGRDDFCGESAFDIQSGGLYLITGGMGEIGLEIAQALLREKDARLLLVGRKPLRRQEAPDAAPPGGGAEETDKFSKAEARYWMLKEAHGGLEYRAADICDSQALESIVSELESRWNTRLKGILHLARVTREGPLLQQTRSDLIETLRPKVHGTLALGSLLRDRSDAFFVAFSSVSSILGTYHMAAYASANRFLDGYAASLDKSGVASKSVAWSIWEQVGADRKYQLRDLSRKRGLHTLQTDRGIRSLLAALHCNHPGVVIGIDPESRFIRQSMAGRPYPVNALRAVVAQDSEHAADLPDRIRISDRFGRSAICTLEKVQNLSNSRRYTQESRTLESPLLARQRERLRMEVEGIWAELLKTDIPAEQADFFDLGGDSLLAAQFVVELSERTQQEIDMGLLFAHPRLSDLVDHILEGTQPAAGPAEKPVTGDLSAEQTLQLLRDYQEFYTRAIRQQAPRVLEDSPVAAYLESIRRLPELASYSEIRGACHETLARISEAGDADIGPLYNRLAIVEAMLGTLRSEPEADRPAVDTQYLEWFQDLLKDLEGSDSYFQIDSEPFLKDLAVTNGRMVPTGGAWVVERSGLERRRFLLSNPGQAAPRALFYLHRVRSFKPLYQLHMTTRFAHRFSEETRRDALVRIAELMRESPEIRGLFAVSWYLDPALKTISPELSYLQELPEQNGARIYALGQAQNARDALTGSAHRTELYKEGRYRPKDALLIWPRKALLAWADSV
ncbi:MAG: AMP-binding protein [Halieaceae bacterium]|jgi:acyl-CoA synthetase (AMP-forming)/AMP-acid ligase II/NAD(P)-dependent dehydrogenase (short-subunit alcohol dehydrogenase family)/acyl carrier protein|nr:AMP-binding protein [Halieaceae bacterium]